MRRRILAGRLAGIVPAVGIAANGPLEKPAPRLPPASAQWAPLPGIEPPLTPAPWLQAQQTHGQRCVTQIGICFLNVPGPIGHPCTCMSAMGPVPGRIVP